MRGKKYIDADALIDKLDELSLCPRLAVSGTPYWNGDMITATINRMATADVAEVVRCKDCIHSRTANFFRGFGCWLTLDGEGNPRIINDGDGYCWRGEKK